MVILIWNWFGHYSKHLRERKWKAAHDYPAIIIKVKINGQNPFKWIVNITFILILLTYSLSNMPILSYGNLQTYIKSDSGAYKKTNSLNYSISNAHRKEWRTIKHMEKKQNPWICYAILDMIDLKQFNFHFRISWVSAQLRDHECNFISKY